MHNPYAGRARYICRCLPCLSDLGKVTHTGGTAFGKLLVATVAVESHGRHAHQHLGAHPQVSHGLCQKLGALHSTLPNRHLARCGPPLGYGLTGQVNGSVDALKRGRINRSARRVPYNVGLRAPNLVATDREQRVSQ